MNKMLLAIVLSVSLPSLSIAGSGKAVLAHWEGSIIAGNFRTQTLLYISNIADKKVKVIVTFYQENGAIFEDTDNPLQNAGFILASNTNITNYTESPANAGGVFATVEFTLPPKQTTRFVVNPPGSLTTDQTRGFATIEWRKADVVAALVAHAIVDEFINSQNRSTQHAISINNGAPF